MQEKRKDRTLDKKWGVLNSHTIICHKSKRFENIVVCASQCLKRCDLFKRFFNIEILLEYIENHPEYEIKGELMAQAKTAQKNIEKPVTVKEKQYWVITENTFEEVGESELINNPVNYLGKVIYEKPKDQYELIVSLKKKAIK
jgi:hypothetical protein